MKQRVNFQTLLERSKQLVESQDLEQLQIQRNVEQIDQASKNLVLKASRISSDTDVAKNKGIYLLANRGFDADKLSRNLNRIDIKTNFEPLEPLVETDLDGFLKHEEELIILTTIEEAKKESVSNFEQRFSASLESEWERAKQRLLEEGLKTKKSVEPPKTLEMPSSDTSLILGSPSFGGKRSLGRTSMDNRMIQYASVIERLHSFRKVGKPFGLLTAFRNVVQTLEDREKRKIEILDCWNLLIEMFEENADADGTFQHHPLIEAQFTDANPNFRKQFALGAKRFLERQYLLYMKKEVASSPLKARRGPNPSPLETIRAFLNVKFEKFPSDMELRSNELPIWALIYYGLRSGNAESLLSLLEQHSNSLGSFPEYFNLWMNGRLTDQQRTSIFQEYRDLSRSRCDPFKVILFNIVGRCDPDRSSFPYAIVTIQDFFWLKLSLLEYPLESTSGSSSLRGDARSTLIDPYISAKGAFSLETLQEFVTERYGDEYWSKQGRFPMLYFFILLMSQQFEKAIRYLSEFDVYAVDMIHFAMSLYFYGVLRQPPSESQASLSRRSLSVMTEPNVLPTGPSLDFPRLLHRYVSRFLSTDPVIALYYYGIIRERANQENPPVRQLYMKELLLESRAFDVLLGDEIKRGQIAELLGPQEAEQVIYLAANECRSHGKFEDAIRLFELAKNFDEVLEILNNLLSQTMTIRNAEREKWVKYAHDLFQKDRQFDLLRTVRNEERLHTFRVQSHLIYFFDLYTYGRYEQALKFLDDHLGIIPTEVILIESRVEAFKSLDHCIKRNFADLLLATMDILYRIYTQLKSNPNSDGGRELRIRELKNRAKVLVTFSGMLPFRLPGDTNAQLIKLEVMIG